MHLLWMATLRASPSFGESVLPVALFRERSGFSLSAQGLGRQRLRARLLGELLDVYTSGHDHHEAQNAPLRACLAA
jgi:hypothetical protein